MSEFGKDINVPSRKGVFIPDITVEMFRNASLEGVEELMASGKMEDISLPSAQPEPTIPLQWIEAQIEWLKSLDNAFSTLTAVQISAMVNKWKEEQDETD